MELHGHEVNNRLLLAMPPHALERLRPALQLVALSRGQTIDHFNGVVDYVYFVNVGFVSMVWTMRDGRAVEVGGIGVEGVTSAGALFGIEEALFDGIVQVPGEGFRIRRQVLRQEMDEAPALRVLLERYAHFLLADLGRTAACNRLHTVEQRCARWLLIAQDNSLSNRFALTHEFLATMLGSRRSGVSVAARALKLSGLIDYTRASVTVLDRKGLEDMACECYRTAKNELDQVFDSFGKEPLRRRGGAST